MNEPERGANMMHDVRYGQEEPRASVSYIVDNRRQIMRAFKIKMTRTEHGSVIYGRIRSNQPVT